MLINYVPGEECRVAVVEDGKLEEFHDERMNAVSRVNNIYRGVVTNVERGIQAAFVDFGVPQHGFLHVTDVHPRYFPGEDDETTERVGKKTPRRERPPIERCFRRGDEVTVQVLKEGVGTKGPTLTSYLSVPGRFLVMMPQMDRVGVSRKVEDEEQRSKMREILDQLDLPEGFGFILRTAGMDRTKLELKRDLAYLLRLWKDMERRLSGKGPRLLYSESDLLLRAIRDQVTADISEVIIDHEVALKRASQFLKIVAPRSHTKLIHYTDPSPIFHAYDIEPQIQNIHAREVPLPSGGRLVIDETEALVAIDVNSGKSRDARDAETNAYRTNLEACDEICRQLRLRDLGGIVVNDLIDMRSAAHRKEVEQRFKERLRRDRARTSVLPISAFGILEMTRQRMRGSQESMHFAPCPTCRGRGLVQRPDSVAADALRALAAILSHAHVRRVEMVVSPRVASDLLSGRRQLLGRLERASAKHVDVRVSETMPLDRVSFYAYDESGADIDVEKLPQSKPNPLVQEWLHDMGDEEWAADLELEAQESAAKDAQSEAEAEARQNEAGLNPPSRDALPEPSDEAAPEESGGRKRRRRRGRRGRGRAEGEAAPATEPQKNVESPAATAPETEAEASENDGPPPAGEQPQGEKKRRRRRRRRGRGGSGQPGAPASDSGQEGEPRVGEGPPSSGDDAQAAVDHPAGPNDSDHEAGPDDPAPGEQGGGETGTGEGQRRKRRRRRRGGKGRSAAGAEGAPPASGSNGTAPRPPAASPAPPPTPKPAADAPAPKRFLYSNIRRKLSPSERTTRPRE